MNVPKTVLNGNRSNKVFLQSIVLYFSFVSAFLVLRFMENLFILQT